MIFAVLYIEHLFTEEGSQTLSSSSSSNYFLLLCLLLFFGLKLKSMAGCRTSISSPWILLLLLKQGENASGTGHKVYIYILHFLPNANYIGIIELYF